MRENKVYHQAEKLMYAWTFPNKGCSLCSKSSSINQNECWSAPECDAMRLTSDRSSFFLHDVAKNESQRWSSDSHGRTWRLFSFQSTPEEVNNKVPHINNTIAIIDGYGVVVLALVYEPFWVKRQKPWSGTSYSFRDTFLWTIDGGTMRPLVWYFDRLLIRLSKLRTNTSAKAAASFHQVLQPSTHSRNGHISSFIYCTASSIERSRILVKPLTTLSKCQRESMICTLYIDFCTRLE